MLNKYPAKQSVNLGMLRGKSTEVATGFLPEISNTISLGKNIIYINKSSSLNPLPEINER